MVRPASAGASASDRSGSDGSVGSLRNTRGPRNFGNVGTLLLILLLLTLTGFGCTPTSSDVSHTAESTQAADGPIHVRPGQDLQQALDRAADARQYRVLILEPGIYQTDQPQFCLLALTSRHSGVTIEGRPGAVLSARSEADPEQAAVSHVIYCGDGLTSDTLIKGITISGARGLATNVGVPVEDYGVRQAVLRQGLFFFMDGGAVKVFGRSSPVFENVVFRDNQTDLCGGAVSIEQQGFRESPVVFRNCQFLNNRCPGTGAAVDVLQGSAVRIDNCLFADNIANYGMQQIVEKYQLSYNGEHGCGALTVFPDSVAWVSRSTFTGNWNAADDRSTFSRYENCIFVMNDASDGSRPGHPYELDIIHADGVTGCFFHSQHPDLRGTISPDKNVLHADHPLLDEFYVPQNPHYRDVGFRP
ncbi:MAG: hypothetical protein RIK87_25630 [Fuerstiella sp.]